MLIRARTLNRSNTVYTINKFACKTIDINLENLVVQKE